MNTEHLARIISAFLDDGTNKDLDGIYAVDKLVRQIASQMSEEENKKFLKLTGLDPHHGPYCQECEGECKAF